MNTSRHQVRCIRKRGDHYNPHERIEGIGGINADSSRWFVMEDRAIRGIETAEWSFYTNVNGKIADVIVSVHNQRKYLKTTADGYAPNNLLNLPECPRG
jgi:hypothetical protein